MFCSNCGSQIAEGAKFCGECGAPVATQQTQQTPYTESAQQTPQMQYTGNAQQQTPQMKYTGNAQQQTPQTRYAGYTQPTPADAQKQKKNAIIIIVAAALVAIFAIGVAIFLLVSLLSFRRDTNNISGDLTGTESTDELPPDEPDPGSTDEAPVALTEPVEENIQLLVEVQTNVLEVTLDTGDGARVIDTITYDLIGLPDDAPMALRDKIEEFNGFIEDYCTTYPISNGPELYDWFTDDTMYNDMPYSETVKLIVYRADEFVLSMAMSDDSYMGGVHPYMNYTDFMFDAQTGERLTLEDIVKDKNALAEAAFAEMERDDRFSEINESLTGSGMESLLELTKSYFAGENGYELPVALTNDGVVLLYGDYMLGSYAAGHAEVFVPYAGNEDIFHAAYFESADASDNVERHVTQTEGRIVSRNLIELCEEEGIDVTQGVPGGDGTGTFYFDGDTELAHITLEADGTFTAYYAHGGVEASGTYEWNSVTSSDYEWTGLLVNADGSTFAEVYYYPFIEILEVNGNYYMK